MTELIIINKKANHNREYAMEKALKLKK